MRDLPFIGLMAALLALTLARPFVGVLLWSFVSFMNPHRLLWGVGAEIPWAAIVFGVTVVGCVLAREPRRVTLNSVPALLLGLLVCFALTSLVALAPTEAVWEKWQAVSKVLLGALLTALLLTDRKRIHALIWIMVIALGFYGVKGGVSVLLSGGGFRVFGPDASMISDNNHIAAALLVTMPLMNYLRLQSRHATVRMGLVGAMGFTLLAVLGSYSRGALLGLIAVALVMAWRSNRRLLMPILLAVALAGGVAFMPERWYQRMESIQTYQADSSATDRLVLWEISLKLALDRPLVGSGFFGPYTRAVVDRVAPDGPARAVHSIWFELLGEHGFPTFFVWVGVTLAGLWHTRRLRRLARGRPDLAWAGDLAGMAQVSIVAYLVCGSFLSLSYWDFYWTLLVVVGAAHVLAMRAVATADRNQTGAAFSGWRERSGVPGARAHA